MVIDYTQDYKGVIMGQSHQKVRLEDRSFL